MRVSYTTWPTEHDDRDVVVREAGTSVKVEFEDGDHTFMVPAPNIGFLVRDLLAVYAERPARELHELAKRLSDVAWQAGWDEAKEES